MRSSFPNMDMFFLGAASVQSGSLSQRLNKGKQAYMQTHTVTGESERALSAAVCVCVCVCVCRAEPSVIPTAEPKQNTVLTPHHLSHPPTPLQPTTISNGNSLMEKCTPQTSQQNNFHIHLSLFSSVQQNAAFVNLLIWSEIADLFIQFLHLIKKHEMTLVLSVQLD